MPGFDEDIHEVQETDSKVNNSLDTVDEILDEEFLKSIEIALEGYSDEDLIWISIDFLNFRENLKHGPKKSYHEINDLRHFSNFKDLKDNLIDQIKKLKSKENINNLFKEIKSSNNKISQTLIEIKENKRLCVFIFNYIKNSNHDFLQFEYHPNIYLHLAHWYFTDKENEYRKNHKINSAIKYFTDNIILKGEKYSKKVRDNHFVDWVYLYLKRIDDNFKMINYVPTCKNNYQLLTTTYLDYLNFYDKIQHENTINKLNKAWSQKKFREGGKVRKPHHLPLTKKTIEKLKKLSAFKNISESDMLEELIDQTFLKEMCDEHGKPKF
ncbi:hypothetical protein [Acinetobacter sp. TAC-1]|uniref:hypothetical protein n=1 Tax=Acinetobacter sp. TAC-1 TaxID=3027470 RepID=UPI0023AAFC11|nr:hypothetical protein [Acinetobacter sp. TAC-1]WEE39368.1 hypothetical protein PYV58_21055 [Acinetobacter sp. TAC-1]